MSREWLELAECRDYEPGIWQSDEPEYDENLAKAVCGRCPVRMTCLGVAIEEEGAVIGRYRAGILGGMTGDERASHYRSARKGARVKQPRQKELTPDEHNSRKLLVREGLSDREVGMLCGVTSSTISKWRVQYGIPSEHLAVTRLRGERMDAGLSDKEIADLEGARVGTVQRWRSWRSRTATRAANDQAKAAADRERREA